MPRVIRGRGPYTHPTYSPMSLEKKLKKQAWSGEKKVPGDGKQRERTRGWRKVYLVPGFLSCPQIFFFKKNLPTAARWEVFFNIIFEILKFTKYSFFHNMDNTVKIVLYVEPFKIIFNIILFGIILIIHVTYLDESQCLLHRMFHKDPSYQSS